MNSGIVFRYFHRDKPALADGGSTFIHILLALIILGLAMAPSIGVFSQSTRLVSSGRAVLEAVMAAQCIMDLALEGPFTVSMRGRSITIPDEALPEARLSQRFVKRYHGQAEIRVEEDPRDSRLIWVEVQVKWLEDGRQLTRTLRTARACVGDVSWR